MPIRVKQLDKARRLLAKHIHSSIWQRLFRWSNAVPDLLGVDFFERKAVVVSDLIPFQSYSSTSTLSERQLNRELQSLRQQVDLDLCRLQAEAVVDRSRISQAAEIQAARIDAVTGVGRHAMIEIALMTQIEQQLSALVPLAYSRLQTIGDMAALGVARVVAANSSHRQ